uniref:Putative dual specificity phosphatase catalytic domain n=1 Tax=viral metagenome TaxID=1070528 RepID=A0A6M3XC56_9ZZZZ
MGYKEGFNLGKAWRQRKEERKQKKQEKNNPGCMQKLGAAWTGYSLCNHYRNPVKVGEWTVLASGFFSRPNEERNTPGAGVYLDEDWARPYGGMTVSPGTEWDRIIPWYPAIYATWQDGSVFPISNIELMIEFVVKHLEAGDSVEIGCQGGHGRTGTFIACLIANVEGLGAKDAIEAVRERHCKDCVETNSQIDCVYNFCGEEAPDRKPKWSFPGTPTRGPLIGGVQGSFNKESPIDPNDESPQPSKEYNEEIAFGGSDGDIDYEQMIYGYGGEEFAECGEDWIRCDKDCEFASAFAIDGRIYCSHLGRYVFPYKEGGNKGNLSPRNGYQVP